MNRTIGKLLGMVFVLSSLGGTAALAEESRSPSLGEAFVGDAAVAAGSGYAAIKSDKYYSVLPKSSVLNLDPVDQPTCEDRRIYCGTLSGDMLKHISPTQITHGAYQSATSGAAAK